MQEEDSISSPGVSYYSLTATTISKDAVANSKNEETFIDPYDPVEVGPIKPIQDGVIYVDPEAGYAISTAQGFFKSDAQVKVLSITADEVVFALPYGVDSATVRVLENGQEREYVFKHRV